MPGFAAGADVVVLGEIHDNPGHHQRQAELIVQIGPAAVVFEMLTPEQAGTINSMGQADPEAIDWAESGWPDFALYAPVFAATEGLQHYGAMLPRPLVRRAFAEPPEQLFAAIWQGDGPPPDFGLADHLPEVEQAEREAGQMASHCDALPPEILPGFVAAQRLRDAALAGEALRALAETGGPVVVIAGNGHAREDWGVPALLARLPDAPQVASLGQFEGEAAEADAPFDATALSPPTPRDDPCRAFRD
ncbi:hypothetical protein DYI42_12255 [Vannielia litorea]|nr:ChaN family lipoprotein [Vannielia litorea]MBS8227006.1 hypothetical protein [Vannielia litorea]